MDFAVVFAHRFPERVKLIADIVGVVAVVPALPLIARKLSEEY